MYFMKYDLHCHSIASDGELAPEVLLSEASDRDIEYFAITDHDTVDGYLSLCEFAESIQEPLNLLSGIEFSCVWHGIGIHVVGLGFDAKHAVMTQAVTHQRLVREQRGIEIAARLAKKGIHNTYEGALAYCDNQPWRIGRPHFAQYLLDNRIVSKRQQAFDRWLGAGKYCDVRHSWPSIEDVVATIVASGGVAVLAHPAKYRMTRTKLRRLVADFASAGGQAMEVTGAAQNPEITSELAKITLENKLAASGGSDFHSQSTFWCRLGEIPPLPSQCQPVWELLL